MRKCELYRVLGQPLLQREATPRPRFRSIPPRSAAPSPAQFVEQVHSGALASGKRNFAVTMASKGSAWSIAPAVPPLPAPCAPRQPPTCPARRSSRPLRPARDRFYSAPEAAASLAAPISESTSARAPSAAPRGPSWCPPHAGSAPASVTSSSVARKAFTSVTGRLRMNPTVSPQEHPPPRGQRQRAHGRVSVANMRASAATWAPVSRLNSVDLPAFVLATSAAVASGTACRCRRCTARPPRTGLQFCWIFPSRRAIRRRSVSSCVSPGPRVPIRRPAATSSMPWPASRGNR